MAALIKFIVAIGIIAITLKVALAAGIVVSLYLAYSVLKK